MSRKEQDVTCIEINKKIAERIRTYCFLKNKIIKEFVSKCMEEELKGIDFKKALEEKLNKTSP